MWSQQITFVITLGFVFCAPLWGVRPESPKTQVAITALTVENVQYDTSANALEFDIVNGTGKDVTALAVQFISANGQTSGQQYDFLPSVGLEAEFSPVPSDPRVHIGAMHTSQRRRFRQHLSARPAAVRVVAVIYGDGATAGDKDQWEDMIAARRADARVLAYSLMHLEKALARQARTKALRDLASALNSPTLLVDAYNSQATDEMLIRMGITTSFRVPDDSKRHYAEWSQKRCASMLTGAADAIEVRQKDPKAVTDSVIRILEKRLQALAKSRIS